MSNPFLSYGSGGSTNISVNSIKPNARGNVSVPLSSLTDCKVVQESIGNGQYLQFDTAKQGWTNVNPSVTPQDISQCEKFFNKNQTLGYCGLDSNGQVNLVNLPNIPESKVANLLDDLTYCEKTANKNTAGGYCGLDSNSKVPVNNIQQIDHTSLSNVGINTHPQIDSFIISKNQPDGLCILNSNSKVPMSNIPQIDHATLSNIGTSTHAQIDTFKDKFTSSTANNLEVLRYDTTQSKYMNSSALTTAVSDIVELKKKTDVSKSATVAINDIITTSYNDDVPYQMIYIDNTAPYWYSNITGFSFSTLHSGTGFVIENNYIKRQTSILTGWSLNSNGFARLNISLSESIRLSKFSFVDWDVTTTAGNLTVQIYGSNNATDATTITDSFTNMTLLGTGTNQATTTINFVSQDTFKYLSMRMTTTTNSGFFKLSNTGKLFIERSDGTNQPLILNTDYTLSTDAITGATNITFLKSGTVQYNLDRIQLYDTYRRLYKVIRDSNNLILTDGTNVLSLTSLNLGTKLIANLLEANISNPSSNQVLQYNGTNWVNATFSAGITALSGLTDVSGALTPSNDQVLVFTTASSLNKWTPYTLTGATFNDTNKTITVSGTTALSGLTTDVNITSGTLANGNLLMHNGTKWINTDSIPDNLFFVKDNGDGTKKAQFELSGITTGTTRVLTIPNASCVIVGDTNVQTLTNKTITDPTNSVMAKYLKSATTTIDVSVATAPTSGQVLTATGASTATWQNIELLAMSSGLTSFFNTETVDANSKGFFGGVYDGKYVYLMQYTGGQITRYDTTLPFTLAGSYSVFDTSIVNANSKGFIAGVYDGRYVYLIPSYNGVAFYGQITRYDTTQNFTSSSSYSFFDTAAVNANSKGFYGGVYDGRYLYLIPYNGATSGQITRYDTTQNFTSSSSYSFFDTAAVNTSSKGFIGGVYDGRYVYLIPFLNGSFFGQITRYDTTQNFISSSSYSFFDTAAVNAYSKGFHGGVYDGRYVYLVPGNNAISGQITRYDTTQDFISSSSYSFFDTAAVNANSKGFRGGVYDGRYVYLAPENNGTSGQITRYDTTQNFISSSSYSFFDTAAVNANSKAFYGGVYDGRYIYLMRYASGQVTRILANQTINTNLNTVKPQLSLQYSVNDCVVNTPVDGNILTYSGTKWINSNTIPDNLLFVKDDIDGTKKMQFQLSSITTGTIRTLTVPDASCVIVGDTVTQTLTNKTIDSTTNIITADKLHSATTTISLLSSSAPTINQALIALDGSSASWQTINHSNISNIGTNTHAQIDTHIVSSVAHGVTGSIIGSSDVQTLTNKTIDSTTNIITADKLHSATSTISLLSSIAPTINQALIALDSSSASWQTINHSNLSNIGANTHAQIDTHIASSIAHGIAGSVVGTTDTQTLTNKTITDDNSNIRANSLRSSSSTVNTSSSAAPTVNQALIAVNSTTASWQTIDHVNLSNKGTNTHAQIDSHISSSSGVHGINGSVVGTSDAQTLMNKTIIDDSSNVRANSLRSASTTINVSNAASPTPGQALIATSNSTATWQTLPAGVTALSLMTDVSTPAPTNQQTLSYDLASNKWVNTNQSLVSTFILNIILDDFQPDGAGYSITASNTVDGYVVDMYYIMGNLYSLFLPLGLSNRQKFFIQCNTNASANPTPLTIIPVNMNNEFVFIASEDPRTSIIGLRGNTYEFTYYTSDNPWVGFTGASYPNWTCVTRPQIFIPKNISLVCFNSRTRPAPIPAFNSLIACELDNKQSIQILDTGGVASSCNLYIYRKNIDYLFQPGNSDYIVMNNNSQNIKRLRIFTQAVAF